jgi:C-terminal processing protease CtpA/Prc
MADAGVPGVVIDLRQNGGGAPIGSFLAGYFTDQPRDLSLDYYYSDETGQLENFRPPDSIVPNDWSYDGDIAVLVSHACASACEDVAWVFSQLPQTTVYGFYSTMGIYGEVGRGQYNLPGGYFFQIPTGLTTDMDGNIIIEGPGVVPDVRVPLDEDTAHRQYVDGEDVLLDAAVEGLGG